MNPVKFDEANKIYTAPKSMPDCKDLHTFQNDEQIISCWEMTAEEKISALFHGRVWLIITGNVQPPVQLHTSQSVFLQTENRDYPIDGKSAIDAFVERKAKQYIGDDEDFESFRFGMQERYSDKDDLKDYLTEFLKFALGLESVDQSKEKV